MNNIVDFESKLKSLKTISVTQSYSHEHVKTYVLGSIQKLLKTDSKIIEIFLNQKVYTYNDKGININTFVDAITNKESSGYNTDTKSPNNSAEITKLFEAIIAVLNDSAIYEDSKWCEDSDKRTPNYTEVTCKKNFLEFISVNNKNTENKNIKQKTLRNISTTEGKADSELKAELTLDKYKDAFMFLPNPVQPTNIQPTNDQQMVPYNKPPAQPQQDWEFFSKNIKPGSLIKM